MPETTQKFLIEKSGRLDSSLGKSAGISRSRVKKLIESGSVQVDGLVVLDADFRLHAGQEVILEQVETDNTLIAEEGEISILYQDEYLAVVEKPAGMTVHPCPSCPEGTLVHLLLSHFPELKSIEGLRPGIVHRLDKDTSGLIVIALKEETRLLLTEAFARREVRKKYLALVSSRNRKPGAHATLPDHGEIFQPIGRHPVQKTKMAVVPPNKGGRDAHSEWDKIYICPEFALIEVAIHTGRTHQIRVHMTDAGYPLLGDATYAPEEVAKMAPRQMLHAWKLSFSHPHTGEEMSFSCPPPADFVDTAMRYAPVSSVQLVLTGNAGCGKSAVLQMLKEQGVPVFSADECIAALYEPKADGWLLLRGYYGMRFTPDGKAVDKKALGQAMKDDWFRQEINTMMHPLVAGCMQEFFQEHAAPVAVAEIPLWFESGMRFPVGESGYRNSARNVTRKVTKNVAQNVAQNVVRGLARNAPENSTRSAAGNIAGNSDSNTARNFGKSGKQGSGLSQTTELSVCKNWVATLICPEVMRHEHLLGRGWDEETIQRMDSWQWTQENKAKASDFIIRNNGTLEDLRQEVRMFLEKLERLRLEEQEKVRKIFQEVLV